MVGRERVWDSLGVWGKFFHFFLPYLFCHFIVWRRLKNFRILIVKFSEVEELVVRMRLQRHHVDPAQPRQGGQDPHVPHRFTFLVDVALILMNVPVIFNYGLLVYISTWDCFLCLLHVRSAEMSRMMKMALRMRTRVMLEGEGEPWRSSSWQQDIRS